jgi:hypothetical protein
VSAREHGRQVDRDNGRDHEKGGGVDKTNRHAYVGVASSALMRCRIAHVHGELWVLHHGATLWPVVVVAPPVKTAVVRSRTIGRRGILRCIRIRYVCCCKFDDGASMVCRAIEADRPKRHFALHTYAVAGLTMWQAWSAGVGFRPYTQPHVPSQGKSAVFGLETCCLQNDLA